MAPSDEDLDLDTDEAVASFLWALDEGSEHAVRGHAYVNVAGDRAVCTTFTHHAERTKDMVARLHRWQAKHPPSDEEKLRSGAYWKDPSGRLTFHADLGAVERALVGRRLVVVSGDAAPPPPLPADFLRAPVARAILAALPDARWPEELDAQTMRFGLTGPLVAREGSMVVVCAARYGSAYVRSGQDRTAAVFLSRDGGATFEELPWRRARRPKGEVCWPPEAILRVRLEGGRLVVDWEDPWVPWEPGYDWVGVWDPAAGAWDVTGTPA